MSCNWSNQHSNLGYMLASRNITLCQFYLKVKPTQPLPVRCSVTTVFTSRTFPVADIVLFSTCSHLASTGQVPNGRFDTQKTFKWSIFSSITGQVYQSLLEKLSVKFKKKSCTSCSSGNSLCVKYIDTEDTCSNKSYVNYETLNYRYRLLHHQTRQK